ncbi:MAG: Gfo/Idh/MocA family oxidoreductase [Ruminococcaceae bacterium]|nr:Gfo/Idh/MocA family oxidoreductase [Oscillospiraceae bacterium]
MLRGAIIGIGGMGRNHLACYNPVKDAKIIALCDINIEVAQNTVRDWGLDIPVYDNMVELIEKEKPDFVDIVTPTDTHAELTIKAFEMGCHVICEKPMALNSADCQKMIEASEKYGKALMIAQVVRFMTPYAYLKNTIETGRLGKLIKYTAKRLSPVPTWSAEDWMKKPERSGGAVIDLAIHDFDFIQWTFGLPEKHDSVHYTWKNETEFISTNMKYDGLSIFVEGGWFTTALPFNAGYTAIFENGVISAEGEAIKENGQEVSLEWNSPEIAIDGVTVESVDGYSRELAYFISCVENGKKPEMALPESSKASIEFCEKLMSEATKL